MATVQFILGNCFLQGRGVEQDDRAAGDWLAKAAVQGYSPAQREFGALFQLGRGTERDLLQAAQLHLAAASAGDALAEDHLLEYRDELVAMALTGNREAAFDLHRIHAEGFGAPSSPALGWAWIRWAHECCPPMQEGRARCEDLDVKVEAVYRFFEAATGSQNRTIGNVEFRAFKRAAKYLTTPEPRSSTG